MQCVPQLLSCTHIKWRDKTELRKAFDSCFYSYAASSNANASAYSTAAAETNVDDGQGRYHNDNEQNNNCVRQKPTATRFFLN